MAENLISQNALEIIFNDPENALNTLPAPVLQCLQLKPLQVQPGGAPERYRMIVSDSRHFCYGMLATQANHIVRDGLPSNVLVRIKSYQANSVKGRNVLIVLDLETIDGYGNIEKVGDPVLLETGGGGGTATTKPTPQQQQPATISGQNFYGNKQNDTKPKVESLPGAPGANTISRKPTSSVGGTYNNTNIYPIEGVSPYAAKWTIKARVASKSDVRHWHKPTGEGKLFSVNLLDESGEIKMTAFNNEVDKYYDILQEGQVYYISTPCKVSFAKKQFTNLPHDFELTLERDTVVEKAEDQASVPQVRYNFCTLQDLQSVDKDAMVDVIGVLKEVGDISEIKSKTTNKPYEKRELQLVDDSGFAVRLTIWGKTAAGFDAPVDSVVAFKGTKVGDFGGRSLSLLSSGTMAVNPDINEAHRLKGWYDSVGRSDTTFATHQGLSGGGLGAAAGGRRDAIKLISQVKEENLGMSGDEYFAIKATIVYIKPDNFAYPACRSDGCSKKMTETTDGTWRCDKCNTVHDRPQHRYIMSINVADHTSQMWLSCFDDAGRAVMGMSADELTDMLMYDDQRKATAFERGMCQTMVFRVRAKMDTYGEAQRVRYQVMSATPVNWTQEAARLTELIKQYDINS